MAWSPEERPRPHSPLDVQRLEVVSSQRHLGKQPAPQPELGSGPSPLWSGPKGSLSSAQPVRTDWDLGLRVWGLVPGGPAEKGGGCFGVFLHLGQTQIMEGGPGLAGASGRVKAVSHWVFWGPGERLRAVFGSRYPRDSFILWTNGVEGN